MPATNPTPTDPVDVDPVAPVVPPTDPAPPIVDDQTSEGDGGFSHAVGAEAGGRGAIDRCHHRRTFR